MTVSVLRTVNYCWRNDIFLTFDEDMAKNELREHLETIIDDQEEVDKVIDEVMDDFTDENGLGSHAYSILSDIDYDCWEWISDIGKKETDAVRVYLLAFELADKQIKERAQEEAKEETEHSI